MTARRGKRSPGQNVSVFVMAHQDTAGVINVARKILRLPVEAHDAVIPADTLVVFRRDAAGIIQGPLASQYHGGFRRHDQNASRMHQHRRFGVPVRLCTDVDAIDHEIDLAAGLSELDNRPQYLAIQSMFSTPLSMEILAPAESVNHSRGTSARREIDARQGCAGTLGFRQSRRCPCWDRPAAHSLHALGILRR